MNEIIIQIQKLHPALPCRKGGRGGTTSRLELQGDGQEDPAPPAPRGGGPGRRGRGGRRHRRARASGCRRWRGGIGRPRRPCGGRCRRGRSRRCRRAPAHRCSRPRIRIWNTRCRTRAGGGRGTRRGRGYQRPTRGGGRWRASRGSRRSPSCRRGDGSGTRDARALEAAVLIVVRPRTAGDDDEPASEPLEDMTSCEGICLQAHGRFELQIYFLQTLTSPCPCLLQGVSGCRMQVGETSPDRTFRPGGHSTKPSTIATRPQWAGAHRQVLASRHLGDVHPEAAIGRHLAHDDVVVVVPDDHPVRDGSARDAGAGELHLLRRVQAEDHLVRSGERTQMPPRWRRQRDGIVGLPRRVSDLGLDSGAGQASGSGGHDDRRHEENERAVHGCLLGMSRKSPGRYGSKV
mgnify:FL=1